jgi:zinc transporter 1/2/3
MLPVKVDAIRTSAKWSGIANSFAGGIFLSLALLHLMPESAELMNAACGGECAYPFAYLIILLGYVVILIIEKVVFNGHHKREREGSSDANCYLIDSSE